MEIGRGRVEKQGWRKGVGPANDDIGIMFTVRGKSSRQTRSADIRIRTVVCLQEGSTNLILIAELVIDPEREAGNVIRKRYKFHRIDSESGFGRHRVKHVLQLEIHGAQHVLRNRVSRECLSGQGIEDRRADFGENALPLQHGWLLTAYGGG